MQHLLTPVIISFLLPLGILVMFYMCALLIQLFHLRGYLFNISYTNYQELLTKWLAGVWVAHGSIWHGYEVSGLSNIPAEGGALIISYHATLPVDLYYLLATIYSKRNRIVYCVGDNLLYKIPGFKMLMRELRVIPGTVATCSELLQNGNLMAIAPGGVREALFGDEYYNLLWANRKGFAKVIKEAGVPVIPMFTKNSREAFRTIGLFKSFFRYLYERYRFPFVPIYGGYPVKLKTYLGEPITFDESRTIDEISDEVKSAIENLIRTHQRIPGRIISSIIERFH
ncbi:hypothetical protein HELRODRAFT_157832 [Helobdella robusta]|uniref:Phospholipid/glycerol acyltransferase domain-containing protein n=1 Tax=Helobdella robusta TaxID=6412 RepID=T1EMG6_HELRO|nr:hypothetical protein HELRODRAFT_157832 [Helobdella robusta]ESN93626.1 hypothetical protein HELRODRAFT_157832 [Helobdella robusta]